MVTIELKEAWTYRTPQVTIPYPSGKHTVFKYVAEKAVEEGAIEQFEEEEADGDTHQSPAPRKARSADKGKG
jgi:hypothetical protein